jgi:hypothetical protein
VLVLPAKQEAELRERPYLVEQAGGIWTIRCQDRLSDRFDDKEDAVLTAIIRAERARRRGKQAKVLVEENGRSRAVWGEETAALPRIVRRPRP